MLGGSAPRAERMRRKKREREAEGESSPQLNFQLQTHSQARCSLSNRKAKTAATLDSGSYLKETE